MFGRHLLILFVLCFVFFVGDRSENGGAEAGICGCYLEHGEGVGGSDSGLGAEGAPAAAESVARQGRVTGHASPIEVHHGLQGDGSISYFTFFNIRPVLFMAKDRF